MLLTDNTPENLSKQENLNELLSGAKEFIDTRIEEGNENLSLSDFLGEVSLATDQDSDDDDGQAQERVTLMTVHAAKGLEFSNVFIVGVEEDLFPSAMSNGSIEEIEEERRLLYVAITRAKNFCMLSYASTRYRNGTTCTTSPSRFLRDIDIQYLNLSSGTSIAAPKRSFESYGNSYHGSSFKPLSSTKSQPAPTRNASPSTPATGNNSGTGGGLHTVDELATGMAIEHSRFGRGQITDIDTTHADPRITVEFDNLGSRVLLLKFARFNILDQ